MAAIAQLELASAPEWGDGRPFSGYVLLVASPPVNRSEIRLYNFSRVPDRVAFRVERGSFIHPARIYRTDYLEPPNVKYLDFWYDLTGALIASGSSQFTVEEGTYQLVPPALAAPAAGEVPLPPGSMSSVRTYRLYYGLWSPDGTQTSFILPQSSGIAIIFLNGLIQQEGVHYTRSGNVVTFFSPPASGDQVGYYLFV